MLEILRPFFRGEWTQYGESLRLDETTPLQTSVAQWLLNPVGLTQALALHAEFLGGARVFKAVASDWMLRYLTALLPPVVALSSLLKYRVPTNWHDMALTLSERGAPAFFAIERLGNPQPAANTATRYDALVWQHLAPFIARMHEHTQVPTKILRGNACRTLFGIFEQALQLVASNTALVRELIEDRRQLLESPAWSDGRRNPLFLRRRQVSVSHAGGSLTLTLHASCCLAHQLPRTGFCGACPLAPEYRKCRTVHSSVHDGNFYEPIN